MSYSIHTLDLFYQNTPETIAAYLILGDDEPILIESGPASTLENLRTAVSKYGLSLSDIKHLLLTHIHLDHSGAAGWLAEKGTQLYVHKVGAPHLIDPTKLLNSAARIYVGQMETLWGKTVPAPAEKVTAVSDGDEIKVGNLTFRCIDSPGHAWHHMAYQLDDTLFSGDSLGNRLNNRPYTVLPAPPPEFKLDIWQQTLDKLSKLKIQTAYPTHFGAIEDPSAHIDNFSQLLTELAHLVLEELKAGKSREEIIERYKAYDLERGRTLGMSQQELEQYVTSNPLHMSVDGITRYWTRKGAF